MSRHQYKKPSVLFVHHYPHQQVSSFIQQDLDLLREWYPVDELTIATFKRPLRGPLRDPVVWRMVARNDVVFAWFGFCTAIIIIATILRKPTLLVSGGGDVVSLPEIGYGLNTRNKRQYFLQTLGFRLARRILPFSEASRQSLLDLPGIHPERVQTLYLGIDSEHFSPCGEKTAQALTVGYITEVNLKRKGLQTFVDAARLAPEISFRVGGKPLHQHAVAQLTANMPPNAVYLGHLDAHQLRAAYRQSNVYAQLSLHEGFGMALAEAMGCGCVPVVTDRGSIPEVVGDTGIYVPPNDPQAAAEAMRTIINSGDPRMAGQRARERIVAQFPLARRKAGLQQIIEEVLS